MGAGKIYKNENAKKNPYWFQVMVDGKRVTKRGFRTKSEAQKARDELSTQLNKREYIEPSKISFKEYFRQWIEARDNISDSTKETYESYYRNHLDLIGNVPIFKLTPLDIQKYLKILRDKGLSPAMIKRIYATINASLNTAVSMEILPKNVASKIPKGDKPRIDKQERQIWENESIKQLLDKSKGETRYWIAIFLAVMTGLRQGEILGLKWSDIDFEKKVLYVRRGLKKDRSAFTNLKTPSSRRTVSISPHTIQMLQEQRERLRIEREALGDEYEDNDMVVCTSRGTPAKATKVLDAWKRLCSRYKPDHEPDITFHDLRHQHASIMLNEGEDIRVVSKRLGHSTVVTTLDVYSHLLPTAQEAAAAKLDRSIGFKTEEASEFLQ